MGTFDPSSMSQIIQTNTFQDVDGSTRTVMEKLKSAVESYDVDTSQFVFLYIPNNIMFLPSNIYNEEIGQCLALIYIPDPAFVDIAILKWRKIKHEQKYSTIRNATNSTRKYTCAGNGCGLNWLNGWPHNRTEWRIWMILRKE